MSRWRCPACRTVYGQLLYAGCPRCPGTELEEQMPKSTVHGGASNADDPRPADTGEDVQPAGDNLNGVVGEHGTELVNLPPGSQVYPHGDDGAEQVEEVPPSAGTSSSTSAAKPRKNTATRKSGSPSPAPTTENP